MNSKIKPKNGYIALLPIEESEEMVGNIVRPDMGKERPLLGEVVEISETYNYHRGEHVPTSYKIGQIVMIPKMGSVTTTIDNVEYYLVKETEIIAEIQKA